MRVQYKKLIFAKDSKISFADFKKSYAGHLVGLSESEVKECYNLVSDKNGKLPYTSEKSEKTKSQKGK